MRPGIIAPLLLPTLVILVAACADDDEGEAGAAEDKVQVVTTLPLFADFVREIGGDRVEVTSLLPLGADPHTFEPSPRDVERVTGADIAFVNGLDLEPALIGTIEPNLPGRAPLVILGEEVVRAGATTREAGEEQDEREEHEAGPEVPEEFSSLDPHLWMDPLNAALYIAIISDRLANLDPEGSATLAQSADRYAGELDEVRDYVSTETESIPEDRRRLVTTHDAFGYFAGAFGFEITEFVIESPAGDPSPEDIAEVSRALDEQEIPAVFAEPQIDEEGQLLEQAADDAGVEVCTLYSDSLDDQVSSYVELMRFNADELVRCLGEP